MEDEPSGEGEEPRTPSEADGDGSGIGSVIDGESSGPEARALAEEAEEIRRLVDAGAGSPEAIRELAARLRGHREREEALWRAEVKPALVKQGKGRIIGHGKPTQSEHQSSISNALILSMVLLGLVVLVVIAANTTAWLLVAPVVALISWAWYQGRAGPN